MKIGQIEVNIKRHDADASHHSIAFSGELMLDGKVRGQLENQGNGPSCQVDIRGANRDAVFSRFSWEALQDGIQDSLRKQLPELWEQTDCRRRKDCNITSSPRKAAPSGRHP